MRRKVKLRKIFKNTLRVAMLILLFMNFITNKDQQQKRLETIGKKLSTAEIHHAEVSKTVN